MKAMQTRLRARRAPFGLPAEGALGWGQEPTSEAKVHLHHAFFEHAGTPGAERLIVFPPKQRLSQARRRRIGKANDFQCRNHYRIGITVLLHRHQEGSADIRPGHTEKVTLLGIAFASSANATVRHNDVSMHSRWRLAARSFITGRRCCHTEAIEM